VNDTRALTARPLAQGVAGMERALRPVEKEPGSYRDRNGAVFYRQGRVFRYLGPRALANWRKLEQEPFFEALCRRGLVVETRDVDALQEDIPLGN